MKKIVIVGCGAVSQLYYSPALHELEKIGMVKVDSIIDPDPDNRLRMLEQFPDSEMISEIHDLKNRNIDLAIVASPPDLHAKQSIELLQMGINVLCEKPIATRLFDAEEMIRVSENTKKLLAIGLFRRHFPSVQTIKQIIAQNILGRIKEVKCQEGNIFKWKVLSPSYFQKSKGGVLLDIGVHALDLLVWWFGKPGELFYEDDALGGIEVNCRLKMTFENNIECELRLSRDTNLTNSYVFYGTKGWIKWNVNEADNFQIGFYDSRLNLSSLVTEGSQVNNPFGPQQTVNNFQQSFTSQLTDVVFAITNKSLPFVPVRDALNSLSIIEYCYNNRNLISMPWLSETENRSAVKLHKESLIW